MVQQAIEETNTQFCEAVNRGDAAAVAALYAEDAKLLPPNTEMVSGRQAIQAFWEGALEMGVWDINLESVGVGYDGNLAYEIGAYTLNIQPEGGQAMTDTGKYVLVRKRQADGTWKMTADIWNSSVPAAGE